MKYLWMLPLLTGCSTWQPPAGERVLLNKPVTPCFMVCRTTVEIVYTEAGASAPSVRTVEGEKATATTIVPNKGAEPPVAETVPE
jgi:hypothetical protein